MPKFLFKANDDVLSHCGCSGEPAMSTGQLDCPWCGCGWLIACSNCAKSFTYAVVRETHVPLVELGRREVRRRGIKSVTEEEIEDWFSSGDAFYAVLRGTEPGSAPSIATAGSVDDLTNLDEPSASKISEAWTS